MDAAHSLRILEPIMLEQPQPEHQWLQQLVGEWTFESEAIMGPDQPPSRFQGSETVTMFGDLWVVCDGIGEMPPGESGEVCHGRMRMTLGYDAQQKKYVGSWIGTMMSNMWVYDCSMDESKTVLTLAARGPAMNGEGVANYKDVMEIVSANERMLKSYIQNADGSWLQFMTAKYKRKS
jgi:hypothetical protein